MAPAHPLKPSQEAFNNLQDPRKVDGVCPPDWDEVPSSQLNNYADNIQEFVDLADQSLSIVQSFKSTLQDVEAHVIRQYLVVVVQTFERKFKDRAGSLQKKGRQDQGLTGKLSDLEQKRRSLETRLSDLGLEMQNPDEFRDSKWRGWIALTIFTPVYAAIAANFCLGRISVNATGPLEIQNWIKQSKKFCPRTIVFDLNNGIIGESRGTWSNMKEIQNWEKRVRNLRFKDSTKKMYGLARVQLQSIYKDHGDEDSRIQDGQLKIEQSELGRYTALHGSGCLWWAMEGETFKHKGPCSVCRVLFHKIRLVPNGEVDTTSTSSKWDKWDEDRMWRCAEADALDALAQRDRQSSEGVSIQTLDYSATAAERNV